MSATRNSILILDDSERDRAVCRKHIERESGTHLTVVEADSIAHALALCARETPDCIVLESRFEVGSGFEFAERLRESTSIVPPLIMLTGRGDEATAVRALKSGFCDYFAKADLDPAAFVASIFEAVELWRHTRSAEVDDVFASTVTEGKLGLRGRVRHLGLDRIAVDFGEELPRHMALGDALALRLGSSGVRREIDARVVVTALSEKPGAVEVEFKLDRSQIPDVLTFERLIGIVNRRGAIRVRPREDEPIEVTVTAASRSVLDRLGYALPRPDAHHKGRLTDISMLGIGVSASQETERGLAGIKAFVVAFVIPRPDTRVIMTCRVRNRRAVGDGVVFGLEIMPEYTLDYERVRQHIIRFVTRRQGEVLQGRVHHSE